MHHITRYPTHKGCLGLPLSCLHLRQLVIKGQTIQGAVQRKGGEQRTLDAQLMFT